MKIISCNPSLNIVREKIWPKKRTLRNNKENPEIPQQIWNHTYKQFKQYMKQMHAGKTKTLDTW